MVRRYASHYICLSPDHYLRQHVVETIDGQAGKVYPLEGEPEDVEWLPGVIALAEDPDGIVRAYHFYPYDFTALRPVDETQRRQLP